MSKHVHRSIEISMAFGISSADQSSTSYRLVTKTTQPPRHVRAPRFPLLFNSLHQLQSAMATPQRRVRQFKKHSKPRTRNRVCSAFPAGKKAFAIALKGNSREPRVRHSKSVHNSRLGPLSSRPLDARQISQPTIKDARDAAAKDTFISLSGFRKRVTQVSEKTIRRYLRKTGIMRRKAAQRPFFKEEHAEQRLAFA